MSADPFFILEIGFCLGIALGAICSRALGPAPRPLIPVMLALAALFAFAAGVLP